MYDPVRVPSEAGLGKARVRLTLPGVESPKVQERVLEVEVVEEPPLPKDEEPLEKPESDEGE